MHGAMVETEGEALGLKTKYKLKRPEKLVLFVDQVHGMHIFGYPCMEHNIGKLVI